MVVCMIVRRLLERWPQSRHYQTAMAGVARGAMLSVIYKISCCFVFREAVSQTKSCCSIQVKIFVHSQNFKLATPLYKMPFFLV